MKRYKPLGMVILWSFIPVVIFAQNQEPDINRDMRFDIGRFSFSLAPKILEDGSITDMGIGYVYTEHFAGELRLRFSTETKNSRFDEKVTDSLNVSHENIFEAFLIPLNYSPIKNRNMEFCLGAGFYYNYDTLTERGYFNMPALVALGKEKVNSFSNDFSLHIVGPGLETGFNWRTAWFALSIHAGIVPVFWLYSHQKMEIVPLMEPNFADYSQNTWGSPYFYADIGLILFKYFSLVFLYDISRLNYRVTDFDSSLEWYNPERETVSRTLKIEASLLIPWNGSLICQIGYGYAFDAIRLDSAFPVWDGKHYLILSVKAPKNGEE